MASFSGDESGTCLLLSVVRINCDVLVLREAGRYESILSATSAIVAVDGTGMDSVGGKERPGKVDRRILIDGAMAATGAFAVLSYDRLI